jgi:ankyrin repeat protein
MWAAAEGNLEVVDALLAAGADYRTPLSSGFTPLFFAVREGKAPVVFRLLKAGLDVNDSTQPERRFGPAKRVTNPLLLALENGHFEMAIALMDAGANSNAAPAGFTPLHAMTWVRKPIRGDGDPPPRGSGNVESLEFVGALVRHGAELNRRLAKGTAGRGRYNTTGSTPFGMAARASDVPLMKLLMDLGADAHLSNADGCIPLLAAAGVGALGDGDEAAGTDEEAVQAVHLLLEAGADINAFDENGETVMHGAAYQERPKLVKYLSDRGADINIWNQKNKWGWTPLMIAQGHRPGNFRPSPYTIAAIEQVMRASGLEPPKATRPPERTNWSNP